MPDYIKPSGITGLNTGHALYGNITVFFEFGQLDKNLVTDTALTITSASTENNANIGDSRIFSSSSSVTQTVSVSNNNTVLCIIRPTGTRQNGDASRFNIGNEDDTNQVLFGYDDAGTGGYFRSTICGNAGAYRTLNGNDLTSDADFQTGQALAFHFAVSGTRKICRNGTIQTNTLTTSTNAFTSEPRPVPLIKNFGAEAVVRIGAVVVFNKLLTDTEMQSVTNSPWDLVSTGGGGPTPKNNIFNGLLKGTTLSGRTIR